MTIQIPDLIVIVDRLSDPATNKSARHAIGAWTAPGDLDAQRKVLRELTGMPIIRDGRSWTPTPKLPADFHDYIPELEKILRDVEDEPDAVEISYVSDAIELGMIQKFFSDLHIGVSLGQVQSIWSAVSEVKYLSWADIMKPEDVVEGLYHLCTATRNGDAEWVRQQYSTQ